MYIIFVGYILMSKRVINRRINIRIYILFMYPFRRGVEKKQLHKPLQKLGRGSDREDREEERGGV